MEKFKFLDITTADVAFESYGKDLGELFSNSALAMFEVITDSKKVKPKVERILDAHGDDLKSLMFNWLNGLLVFLDSEGLVFCDFSVKVDPKDFKLKATCSGEKFDKNRHEAKTVVKAATYHMMKIERSGNIWKAQVILDI